MTKPSCRGTGVVVVRLPRNVIKNKEQDRSPVIRIRTKAQNETEIKDDLPPKQTVSKRDKALWLRLGFLLKL